MNVVMLCVRVLVVCSVCGVVCSVCYVTISSMYFFFFSSSSSTERLPVISCVTWKNREFPKKTAGENEKESERASE